MAGTFVSYSEKNVNTIEDVYGVYALAVGLKDTDNVRVFYVGSGNIGERLTHHLSDSEENECIKKKVRDYICYFWYEEVQGGEEKRKTQEVKLLAHYREKGNAECNKISP